MWRTLSDPILSLIYPQECAVCHNEVESSRNGIACDACWQSTKIFSGSETLCSKCGAFLFEGSITQPIACQDCREHEYDGAASAGLYEGALSASVLRLKRVPHVSSKLREVFFAAIDRMTIEPSTIVIPVPLAARRLNERGFNQAAILARLVSQHTGLAFDERSFIRKIHTPMHRVGMDAKARAMTVRNAFEVVRPKLIDGRHLLLVDDVFTSGETSSICARVLKKSGAATVKVLTIARAATRHA